MSTFFIITVVAVLVILATILIAGQKKRSKGGIILVWGIILAAVLGVIWAYKALITPSCVCVNMTFRTFVGALKTGGSLHYRYSGRCGSYLLNEMAFYQRYHGWQLPRHSNCCWSCRILWFHFTCHCLGNKASPEVIRKIGTCLCQEAGFVNLNPPLLIMAPICIYQREPKT